jgi:outer membrane receptor protein involved in Fe transport
VLTLSGSFRFNHFDINVVPDQHVRNEAGFVADDDILLSDAFRLRLGGRFDWFSSFGATVSPRLGFTYEPVTHQVFRASYNRAYVAPSFLENYFYYPTETVIGLPTGPYALPFVSQGNQDLDPLTLDAFEVGYTGMVGSRATFGAAFYRNRTKGIITLVPTELYTPGDPPPGWPLPPEALAAIPLPKTLTEMNLGEIKDRGFELSADVQLPAGLSMYANYSLQTEPRPTDELPIQINIPSRHRVNVGAAYSRGRYFGTLSVAVASRAFWADVQPFSGYTDGYALVNGGAGVRLWTGRSALELSVKAIDIGNQAIRQHIFSDVLRRRVVAQARIDF